MVKEQMMITIDADTRLQFVEQVGKGNVSKTVEEMMQSYTKNTEKEGLDEAILEKNCEILRRKIANYSGNFRKDSEKLLRIREEKEKNRLSGLKQEQEQIKKARRCIICGTIANENFSILETPKGLICHSCKMGMAAHEVAKYTK